MSRDDEGLEEQAATIALVAPGPLSGPLVPFHAQFVQGKEAREGTFAASIINSGIEAANNEAKSAADKTKG